MLLPCALCGDVMQIAEGQLAFVHRKCRKQARKEGLRIAIENSKVRFYQELDTKQRLDAVKELST